ncbi:MAG: tetratricopeptide repeat protein [Candidatus Kariarchaeaceae archaeon]|jgi:chromosome segregation ATPase
MNASISYSDGIKSVYDALHMGQIDQALKLTQDLDKLEELTTMQQMTRNVAKAKVLIEIGDTDEALNIIQKVLGDKAITDNKPLHARAKATHARAMVMFGEHGDALSLAEEVERLYEKMIESEKEESEPIVAEMKSLIGLIYNNQGELDAALQQYKDSMSICKKLNLRKDLGMLHFNIGSVYKLQDKLSLSITYLEQAVEIFRDINYYEAETTTLQALEEIHRMQGDEDLAFVYKQKQDSLTEKLQFTKFQLESTKEKQNLERLIEKLNNENIELKQQIWSYKFEIDASEGATDESRTLPGTLLQTTTNELEKTRKELEKTKDLYEEVRSELSNNLTDQREIEQKLRLEFDQYKTKSESEIKSLKSELESTNAEKTVEAQKSRVTELALDEKLRELEKLETKLKELDTIKSQMGQEATIIAELKKEKIDFQAELSKLSDKNSIMEAKIELLNETIDKGKKEGHIGLDDLKIQYEREITELKDRIFAMSDVENRANTLSDDLLKANEKVRELKSELTNYKNRYENAERELSKEKTTARFDSKKPTKDQRIPLQPRPQTKQPLTSPMAGTKPIHARGLPGTLEDFLNKDKLAQKISEILKNRPKIQLRMLSMQLGSSPAKIIDTISQLEDKGFLKVNYAYKEDPNPEITKAK